MKVRNLLLKLMFCLMIIFGVQLKANAVDAIATVGPNTPAANIQYPNAGCAGPFILNTNNAFIRSKLVFGWYNPNVTVTFTPNLVGDPMCGNYLIDGLGIWRLILQGPNGAPVQFTVTDNATGMPLLEGTFRRAILHGTDGSSSLALTLYRDSVVYNPAHSPWLVGYGPDDGSLSIAILSRLPVPAGANGPAAFQANGDINFGATD
jgi:hypothetical protein